MYLRDNALNLLWLVLCGLTLATWLIGEEGYAGRGVVVTLLLIAFIKGQLVANYFMGLRHAGWLWRGIVMVYFTLVGGLILIAYLTAAR